jgi:hypothetical protein
VLEAVQSAEEELAARFETCLQIFATHQPAPEKVPVITTRFNELLAAVGTYPPEHRSEMLANIATAVTSAVDYLNHTTSTAPGLAISTDVHAACLREDRTEDAPHWGDEIFSGIDRCMATAFEVMPEYREENGRVDSTWVCDTVERLFTAIHAQPTPGLRYTAVEAALRALLHSFAWPKPPTEEAGR